MIDVKQMVREAVGGEWDGFCVRHPRLSRMVSRELMVERCLEDLRESEEFEQALAQVEMAGEIVDSGPEPPAAGLDADPPADGARGVSPDSQSRRR